jgi:hypothetical protein
MLALMLALRGVARAQEEPKYGNLPDAPAPKQSDSYPNQKPENTPLKSTLVILGRRSVFFPDLATSKRAFRSRQKLELAIDETIAPSRFLASAFTAGI